jgi:hypothetical protein
MPADLKAETQEILTIALPTSENGRSAHTEKAFALVDPLHEAIDHVHDHMTTVLRAVRRARGVETHDHAIGMFSRIQNSAEAALQQVKAAEVALDHVTNACRNLDDCMLDWKKSLDTHDERVKPKATGEPAPNQSSASGTQDASGPDRTSA